MIMLLVGCNYFFGVIVDSDQIFKTCKICGMQWITRDQFINDPQVVSIGYQANFVILGKGLFLFNHSCQSTLSVEVQAFQDLYAGPMFEDRLTRSEACRGYCLHRNNLRPCPEQCECAYVREILGFLQKPALTAEQIC